jgi:hypothetical protein
MAYKAFTAASTRDKETTTKTAPQLPVPEALAARLPPPKKAAAVS